MYSLLIAEDESWMREVLVNADYWKHCGITRIFEAGNGEDAYGILQTEKVDFLLSDIRMPIMDGLELLSRIQDTHPETIKVMLTGFDDFEYVRTAMRLDAHDYMLKPVHDEEMLQLFLRLARQKNERQAEKLRRAAEESKWNHGRQMLREQLLASWFSGKKTDENGIRQQCRELGIHWQADRYVVMLLEADRLHALLERYSRRDFNLLYYGIRNIAEEYVKESGRQYYLFELDERIVIWCESTEHAQDMESMLERIRESVKRFIKVSVSVGVSGRHESESEVFQAYMEALNSLKMKMYYGNDRATFYESLILEDRRKTFGRDLQVKLFNCITAGQVEETEALLAELFGEIRRNPVPAQQMDEMLQAMAHMLRESRERAPEAESGHAFDEWLAKARTFDMLDELRQFVTEAFMAAASEGAKQKMQRKSKLIVDVLHYLEEHYMEDISLQKLAERFFVNASYLSRLFKEEVGEIFTKHVMRLRIERACRLLRTTHMKVYEVSEAVGYRDVKYFNKIFKDITGMTPADHRSLSNT
ncbi:Regulator of RpoS [Paenibacillus sp. CECT 9249]|uniref:response regulator n=1 Tax=Paenibacillus sp. CECT 9249 TaxID=2845385 RepID=UPI001E640578|nr:response regulator [Paenibacillus sp. CECT 9249]CAH0120642.1 Regulator of RpoS [Paenibacillus sp. CECT 9249]